MSEKFGDARTYILSLVLIHLSSPVTLHLRRTCERGRVYRHSLTRTGTHVRKNVRIKGEGFAEEAQGLISVGGQAA